MKFHEFVWKVATSSNVLAMKGAVALYTVSAGMKINTNLPVVVAKLLLQSDWLSWNCLVIVFWTYININTATCQNDSQIMTKTYLKLPGVHFSLQRSMTIHVGFKMKYWTIFFCVLQDDHHSTDKMFRACQQFNFTTPILRASPVTWHLVKLNKEW